MGLKIYNTLTRKKEPFQPVHPGKVGMYVCGVTVYDMCHIGHARSVILFDVIYRYLIKSGLNVTYVRNFTDIDDKIINRANQLEEDWQHLTERYIDEFHTDMDALGVKRPDIEPKATDHIQDILSLIGALIDQGHAYEVNGDVMFSVTSFPTYGRLSGKRTEDLLSGARVNVDEKKKDPLDFALWKAAKKGEPFWNSPWGPGRPGWHIECSAMSMRYLGSTFDIHGGGADLTFPHHENEIAQSEAATGEPFARYWIHNGFVNIRSEKMSKSVGNVLNIRDILNEIHPEALRLFLLSSHYRSPLDFNDTSIREAFVGLERLYGALLVLNKLIDMDGKSDDLPEELTDLDSKFQEVMDDDFNTPRGLALLFEASRAVNRLQTESFGDRGKIPAPLLLENSRSMLLGWARDVFGLLNEKASEFVENLRRSGAKELSVSEEEIERLVQERSEARKAKNFKLADEIRNRLLEQGILIEDGPKGPTWRVKD
ncbi:MAG: cysteine--tRNA ligase [Deltaproteobacteria bacterium]|nr:cysteine--tRNA ligase [Deltaproteobacteria bacterium]